jgi:3-deoxy-D-manno-octulosonic-acid transferase
MVICLPWLLVRSWRTGKYRQGWAGRLGRLSAHQRAALMPRGRRVLLHCVSVGELASASVLIQEILQLGDDIQVIVTVTTDTGLARALKIYPPGAGRVLALRYPLDFSFSVKSFLDAVKPTVVGLIELELWPNFMQACRQRNIPVEIINGRMTERSLRRYAMVRPIMRRMLLQLRHIGVQSEAIGNRFKALGADERHMTVMPTIKYDTADFATSIAGADELAAALGLRPSHWLFTAGSIGPGEEEPLLDAYQALQPTFDHLRLCIAPRKPEIYSQVEDAIRRRGLVAVRRSAMPDGRRPAELGPQQVVMLDSFGELKRMYAISAAIFSGRSLVPLGGSDMIEAAALGKPVCFGPHTWNFADVAELLLAVNGAVLIDGADGLKSTLQNWLTNESAARLMAQRGRSALLDKRGSSVHYAKRLVGGLRPVN